MIWLVIFSGKRKGRRAKQAPALIEFKLLQLMMKNDQLQVILTWL